MPLRQLVVLVAALAIGLAPAARADGEVHGDDADDAYVATGSLLLPPSVDPGLRRKAASCPGCTWQVSSPCTSTDDGVALDDTCRSVVRGCPGGRLLRIWYRPPDGAWRATGLTCLRDGQIWTVEEAGQAIRQRLARAVPRPALRTSPPRGVLPHLPTHFATGMPRGIQTFDMTVAGHDMVVRALPDWTWSFGDGAAMRTGDPGGEFPSGGVTHVYRVAGRFRVECSTEWTAEFWSDGLGPFPVPEGIRLRATIDVAVGEGRAVLIPDASDPAARGTMVGRPARPS